MIYNTMIDFGSFLNFQGSPNYVRQVYNGSGVSYLRRLRVFILLLF